MVKTIGQLRGGLRKDDPIRLVRMVKEFRGPRVRETGSPSVTLE